MKWMPFRALIVVSISLMMPHVSFQNVSAHSLFDSEVDVYGGPWIAFLPSYKAISHVGAGGAPVFARNIFQDNQDDVGLQIGMRGLHRLGETRTMLEFDVNVAGIDDFGSSETLADPNATSSVWMSNLIGDNRLATPDGTSATFRLNSDVLHYSEFVGLRDRFDRTPVGTVDLGLGFSHMAFDQDFSLLGRPLNGGLSGEYVEKLDTHYFGAELRATTYRRVGKFPCRLDLGFGLYDMNSDYEGASLFRTAAGVVFERVTADTSLHRTAATVTVGLKADHCFKGVLFRPGINFKYISHMANIIHPQANVIPANPVSLDTKAGFLLGVNLEILMCCRNRCCR